MFRFFLLFCMLALAPCLGYAQSTDSSALDTSIRSVATAIDKPVFPGGENALYAYVAQQVNYPALAVEKNIEGMVVVSFVVEKDGSLSNVKVVRSVHPLLDREALRVIGAMPRWTPGKQNGKEVRVQFNLPVDFRLN